MIAAPERPAEWLELGSRAGAWSLAGTKADPGWRCQDAYLIAPLSESVLLAAVFDGHGFHGRIAAFVARHVFDVCARAPESDEAAEVMLRQLFDQAHAAIGQQLDSQGQSVAFYTGTTATAAIVDFARGTMCTAHAGDSRLVLLGGDRQVAYETSDHVVDDATAERVRLRGGEVRIAEISGINARRVYLPNSPFPGIMMSRSLGDYIAHSIGLLHEPEVHVGIPIDPSNVLVIASDGVWEHMKSDEAAAEVARNLAQCTDPEQLSRQLVESARARWPAAHSDDITALVVLPPAWAKQRREEVAVAEGAPAAAEGVPVSLGGKRLKGFSTSTAGISFAPSLSLLRQPWPLAVVAAVAAKAKEVSVITEGKDWGVAEDSDEEEGPTMERHHTGAFQRRESRLASCAYAMVGTTSEWVGDAQVKVVVADKEFEFESGSDEDDEPKMEHHHTSAFQRRESRLASSYEEHSMVGQSSERLGKAQAKVVAVDKEFEFESDSDDDGAPKMEQHSKMERRETRLAESVEVEAKEDAVLGDFQVGVLAQTKEWHGGEDSEDENDEGPKMEHHHSAIFQRRESRLEASMDEKEDVLSGDLQVGVVDQQKEWDGGIDSDDDKDGPVMENHHTGAFQRRESRLVAAMDEKEEGALGDMEVGVVAQQKDWAVGADSDDEDGHKMVQHHSVAFQRRESRIALSAEALLGVEGEVEAPRPLCGTVVQLPGARRLQAFSVSTAGADYYVRS